MRILFGWRFWAAVCVSAGAIVLVAKSFSIDQPIHTLTPAWFKQDHSQLDADFSNLLVPLPGSSEKRGGVKIYDENDWQVYRAYPGGHLDVFFKNAEGRSERLSLSAGWRRDSYPMLMMSVPGRLFFVGYDVVRNVPSGRSLSVNQPGFDVYELTPDTRGEPRVLAAGVDLGGGLDSIIYGRVLGEKITLCAENKCANVNSTGMVTQWSLDELSGYEFVEVAFGTDSTYALVRKQWDDRVDGRLTADYAELSLATLSSNGAVLESVVADGIPYALVVVGSKASWRIANSPNELSELLLYELSRMPSGGLISFGDNNLEGRVAWSQVYYLNGLISLAQGDLRISSPEVVGYARQRVRAEIDLIARLAESEYPGYRVKRYSIDREPLLFSLHIGRIAGLLARADRAGLGGAAVTSARAKLRRELLSFEHTVEHPVACELAEVNDCLTLEYRQGYPFWADGVNVPFNFVSGYVGGLLATIDDSSSSDFAVNLMKPLQVVNKLSELPQKWLYWAFDGQAGWNYSAGKSLNTINWVGNHAGQEVAHITYRSMDASSLLSLYQRRPDVADAVIVDHMKQLVSIGMLLPSVNEVLSLTDSVAPLDADVARRFSRSAQPWQIQSQVWALSDFAGRVGR